MSNPGSQARPVPLFHPCSRPLQVLFCTLAPLPLPSVTFPCCCTAGNSSPSSLTAATVTFPSARPTAAAPAAASTDTGEMPLSAQLCLVLGLAETLCLPDGHSWLHDSSKRENKHQPRVDRAARPSLPSGHCTHTGAVPASLPGHPHRPKNRPPASVCLSWTDMSGAAAVAGTRSWGCRRGRHSKVASLALQGEKHPLNVLGAGTTSCTQGHPR